MFFLKKGLFRQKSCFCQKKYFTSKTVLSSKKYLSSTKNILRQKQCFSSKTVFFAKFFFFGKKSVSRQKSVFFVKNHLVNGTPSIKEIISSYRLPVNENGEPALVPSHYSVDLTLFGLKESDRNLSVVRIKKYDIFILGQNFSPHFNFD